MVIDFVEESVLELVSSGEQIRKRAWNPTCIIEAYDLTVVNIVY